MDAHPDLRAMAEEAVAAETKKPEPPGRLRLQLAPLVNKETSQ